MEAIIDTHLRASVCLHNVLHGFHTLRGTETVILDLKLAQKLTCIDQDPILLVFLDLCKVHNMVDHGPLLIALEVYSAGPHICRLLVLLLGQQEVVIQQNGYCSPHFIANRETTQGGLIFSTLINLIVNNVVWNCLALTVDY